MKNKFPRYILWMLIMAWIFCFSAVPVWAEPQGTGGTELQVIRVEEKYIPVVNHGSSNCFDFDCRGREIPENIGLS